MTELKILAVTILFGGVVVGKEILFEGKIEKSKTVNSREKV